MGHMGPRVEGRRSVAGEPAAEPEVELLPLGSAAAVCKGFASVNVKSVYVCQAIRQSLFDF